MQDTTLKFGQDVYSLIFDKIKEYDYPVCFNFPVGHQTNNYALKTGAGFKLKVGKIKLYWKNKKTGRNIFSRLKEVLIEIIKRIIKQGQSDRGSLLYSMPLQNLLQIFHRHLHFRTLRQLP